MERTDSSAAMTTLVNMYGEDDESDPEDVPSFVDKISDDESAIHMHEIKPEEPTKDTEKDDQPSSVSPVPSVESVDAAGKKRRATKLVSYGADEIDEEHSSDSENSEDLEAYDLTLVDSTVNNTSLSLSVRNMPLDSVTLPPEPAGRCSIHLQNKISKMYEKVKQGYDITDSILRRKHFRNPSIYEKLIEYCGIDEKGTNYPPDIFDAHCWGKESFYDSLAEAQKKEMDKRDKEKKERTKIEFITGVKKPSSNSVTDHSSHKRTKWDMSASSQNRHNIVTTTNTNLPIISTTTSVSGAKTTLISAVGNIMKK